MAWQTNCVDNKLVLGLIACPSSQHGVLVVAGAKHLCNFLCMHLLFISLSQHRGIFFFFFFNNNLSFLSPLTIKHSVIGFHLLWGWVVRMYEVDWCTCFGGVVATHGENLLLVQMTWLSLRNNWLKLKTSGKLLLIKLEEFAKRSSIW